MLPAGRPRLPRQTAQHAAGIADLQPDGRLLLTIDLVPRTAWGVNVRSEYAQHWDTLRREAYRRARWRCECCRSAGQRLEAHEVWDYSRPPVQRLVRLVALCSACHSAKHYGMAQVRGCADQVDEHIKMVNGWDRVQLREHIAEAFATWEERSRVEWQLDLTVLDQDLQLVR